MTGLRPGGVEGWAAYPAGVVWALAESGASVPGARIEVDGDVPAGAGLSSSAALECADRDGAERRVRAGVSTPTS